MQERSRLPCGQGHAFSVKSSALPEFWTCFEQLPAKVQKIARKNFALWQKECHLSEANSSHPLLGYGRTS